MRSIMRILNLVFLLIFCQIAKSQTISAEVSRDTLLANNTLTLTIKLENFNGEIEKPELIGLSYTGGISQSSNMQIINGDILKSMEYRYTLIAEEVGSANIGPAFAYDDKVSLETEPISIEILANPDGTIEKDPQYKSGNQFFFEWNMEPKPQYDSRERKEKKTNKRIRRI